MKCCTNCFSDEILISKIDAESKNITSCDFCGSHQQKTIESSELSDIFSPLISIYGEDINGDNLTTLISSHWDIFSKNITTASSIQLLSEITGEANLATKKYSLSNNFQKETTLPKWHELKNELTCKNRYFPSNGLSHTNSENLKNLFDQLIFKGPLPEYWFRSRISANENPIPLKDMGSPPPRITGHGRANPAGIPYLYLASDVKTAISEIRPHRGSYITVAKFKITQNLSLIDLRDPKRRISPFNWGEEETIARLLSDLHFFESLGTELSAPVLPEGAAIDYVPSQYICEFIKNLNYDGVIYSSSVGDGINLALFDQDKTEKISVEIQRVGKVIVELA